MACESLVHAFGQKAPRITWKLVDIATKYAMGEEVVLTNFDGKRKAHAHQRNDEDDNADIGTYSQCREERYR